MSFKSSLLAKYKINAHEVSPNRVWEHIKKTQTNREQAVDEDFKELIMSLEWELINV